MNWNPFDLFLRRRPAADVHKDPESGREYTLIKITGDIEAMAEQMIANSLPPFFFDDIDLSADEGKAQFLFGVVSRPRYASLERDEVVRFAERNRAVLESNNSFINDLREAGDAVEGGKMISDYLGYLMPQVDHAIAGHPELIDVKSDRLLWLLWAGSQALENDLITYEKVLEILRKPENRARISPLSLMFMLQDYVGTIGEAQQPPPENVMLIVECALLTSETAMVRGGVMLLGQITSPKHAAELLDLLRRANAFLAAQGMSDSEAAETTERLAKRLSRMSDDDL